MLGTRMESRTEITRMFTEWITTGTFALLETIERNKLINHMRSMCHKTPPDSPVWEEEHDDPVRAVCAQIMNWGLGDLPESLRLIHRTHRHVCLQKMVRKNSRLAKRRGLALGLVDEYALYFGGWDRLCSLARDYQLDKSMPWFAPVSVLQIMRDVRQAQGSTAQLEACGYVQLDQTEYRFRIRDAVVATELSRADATLFELRWFAYTLALFTSNAAHLQRTPDAATQIATEELSMLRQTMVRRFEKATFLRVPMALYQLNRHRRVLSSVYLTCKKPEEFESIESDGQAEITLPERGVRVIQKSSRKQPGQRQLAMFVDDMTLESERYRSFFSVPLQEVPGDPIASLIATIKEYPIGKQKHLEHLPRVVAGIFAAAHRDRAMNLRYDLVADGVFWDTDSGKRLCQLIGFNPNNHKHLARITSVRALLEKFTLHRQFQQLDETGTWVSLNVSSPIIQPTATELNLSVTTIEGLSSRHTWKAWRIEEALWKSTLDEKQGGAPAFMLIDERAFRLDSPAAFNLYWTLINRAYFALRGSARAGADVKDAEFRERIGVLYDWSGMERAKSRVQRERVQLAEALDEMQRHQLIESWSCDALDTSVKNLERAELTQAQLSVRLPESIVQIVSEIEPPTSGAIVLEHPDTHKAAI